MSEEHITLGGPAACTRTAFIILRIRAGYIVKFRSFLQTSLGNEQAC
jgi:hypothetical protein